MGTFYTNVTVKGPTQAQVVDILKAGGRTAYVSPTVDGFTVVYDRQTEDQDEQELIGLACQLSTRLGCPALAALVHDSDIFVYWLCEAGQVTDCYNSAPDYFEPEMPDPPTATGGDAAALCRAFGQAAAAPAVADLFEQAASSDPAEDEFIDSALFPFSPNYHETLQAITDGSIPLPGGDYLFAEDIHGELAALLGMPPFAAGVGYLYLENGELPEGLAQSDLARSP